MGLKRRVKELTKIEVINKVFRLLILILVIVIAPLHLQGVAEAAFSITKTVDISDPNPGDFVIFTIDLGNTPRNELANATLSDNLSSFEEVTYSYTRVWSGFFDNESIEGYPWTGSFNDFTGSFLFWNYTVRIIRIRAKIPEVLAGQDVTNVATISRPGSSASSSVTISVQGGGGSEAPQIFPSYSKPIPPLYQNSVQPNVLLLLDTSGSMTFGPENDVTTYGDGTKPVSYNFPSPQFYYGQDLDGNNNDPQGPYNYHADLKYIPQSEINLITSQQGSEALAWLGGEHPNDDPPEGYSRYKYPNDSRLYKMKLVLNEIFSDQQLIFGLRIALATYDQTYSSSGIGADWYGFWCRRTTYPYQYRETQNLHYGTGGARALLRVNFDSTDNSSHLSNILQWFDGREEEGNPELRGQGGTPLAASIYGVKAAGSSGNYSWDATQDSAVKFFKGVDAIQWRCQYNWLIVLTDGEDTDIGDPVEAAKRLYQERIRASRDNGWSLPIRTLVIGLIDPDEMESLAVTLNQMADVGWDGQVGEADPSDPGPGAFFATDIHSLLAHFRKIFKIIQTSQTTGGAPMVSPARTEAGESSIYVASFLPQESSQWKGHLYQYYVDEVEGLSDDPEWDASDSLKTLGPDGRNICTIDWAGAASPKAQGLGNGSNFVVFSTSAFLEDEVTGSGEYVLSSGFLAKFIDWVRGSDVWNEEPISSSRFMFADVYHGGVTEVGVPRANYPSQAYAAFAADHAGRKKILYLQGNAGLLHAIDPEDEGKEEWAFIPPNVLGNGRLLGLKANFANDGTVELINDVPSVPRYLLDGPLVAEDVLLQEEWKTILIGCLGYGGQGLYALDVTDPEEPAFLWAVENNIVSPDGSSALFYDSRKIHYWKRSGGLQADYSSFIHSETEEELDYSDLFRTLSTPILAYASGVVEEQGLWENRWVVAIGNGHPGSFEGTSPEGVVYMIDVENGEILRKLTVKDSGGVNVLKPVCAPVTGFTRNLASRVLDNVFAGDIEGNVYSWTAYPDNWGSSLQIFQAGGDDAGITYRMDVGVLGGQPWLFYQTGDMENLNYSSSGYRLYALNTARASVGDPLTIQDLDELSPIQGISSSVYGWYMNFRTSPTEIPTTPVTFYNGYLLFGTFSGDLLDPCAIGGSRFYAVNAMTGGGAWGDGKKYVDLGGLQITGITVFDDSVYLGVVGMASEQDLQSALGESARLAGNLLSFELPEEIPSSEDAGTVTEPGPIFWREWRIN